MNVPSSSLQGSEGKYMSKPCSIDAIEPDLLSFMSDSSGAVLPHPASTSAYTHATGEDGGLSQQLAVRKVLPDLAQVPQLYDEVAVRQNQEKRRQQRRQSGQEQLRSQVSVSVPRAVRSPSQMYLRVQQLAERWDVSVPTVWRWAADGKTPSPIRLSAGTTRWRLDEIEAYERKLEGGK